MQWKIDDSGIDAKKLRSMPKNVQKRWSAWVDIVLQDGPDALADYKNLHDEALVGEWEGHRSSRLSGSYRVIYRRMDEILVVNIDRISKHDYKRRR